MLLTGAAPSQSSPKASGSIAVGGVGDSNVIYLLAADGSRTRKLRSSVPGEAASPALSPDGQRIAFTLLPAAGPKSRIELMSSTGADERPFPGIPSSSSQPAWSRDGRLLAFATSTASPFVSDLYTVSAAGHGLRRVVRNGSPGAWSSDDRRLVYTVGGDQPRQVGVVAAAGGRARILAREGWDPTFAPDGEVAYTGPAGGGSTGIYLVAAAGGHPRLLLRNAFGAAYSPDGRFLAALRPISCSRGLCRDRVFVTDAAAGTSPKAIGPVLVNVQSRLSWGESATPGSG